MTLDRRLEKGLDGCYTRMLRMARDVSWSEHMTNKELYGKFTQVTEKIRQRRLKLAGYCQRHPELLSEKLIPREPNSGIQQKRKKKVLILRGTARRHRDVKEIRTLMENRELWRNMSNDVREVYHPP